MAGRRRGSGASRGSRAITARTRSAVIIVRRRFQRSMKTPASGPSRKTGAYWAINTPLTAAAEWVSTKTQTSSVVLYTKSPMLEIACPIASCAKLRLISRPLDVGTMSEGTFSWIGASVDIMISFLLIVYLTHYEQITPSVFSSIPRVPLARLEAYRLNVVVQRRDPPARH